MPARMAAFSTAPGELAVLELQLRGQLPVTAGHYDDFPVRPGAVDRHVHDFEFEHPVLVKFRRQGQPRHQDRLGILLVVGGRVMGLEELLHRLDILHMLNLPFLGDGENVRRTQPFRHDARTGKTRKRTITS